MIFGDKLGEVGTAWPLTIWLRVSKKNVESEWLGQIGYPDHSHWMMRMRSEKNKD
jgi:hypothetical protein